MTPALLLFLILAIYTILVVVGGIKLKDNELLWHLYAFLVSVGIALFTKVFIFHLPIFFARSEIKILVLIIILTVAFVVSGWTIEKMTGNPLYGRISSWLMVGWIYMSSFLWWK